MSTGGLEQLQALQKTHNIKLNTNRAYEALVKFGVGKHLTSIGTVDINTKIGMITFHIIPKRIPFLFGLADMDRLHNCQ